MCHLLIEKETHHPSEPNVGQVINRLLHLRFDVTVTERYEYYIVQYSETPPWEDPKFVWDKDLRFLDEYDDAMEDEYWDETAINLQNLELMAILYS